MDIRGIFRPTDRAVLAAGIAGLLVYFLAFPSQDPDSAADFRLSHARAEQVAAAYAQQHGVALPEEQEPTVQMRRADEYLESIQEGIGRPRAVRALQTDSLLRLPAYYWRITWRRNVEEGDDLTAEITLTADGSIRSFDAPIEMQSPVGNSAALMNALALDSAAVMDSTRMAELAFVDDAPGTEADAGPPAAAATRIDSVETVRLARFHLQETALANIGLTPDSIWRARTDGLQTAGVRFERQLVGNRMLRADVTVARNGSLLELETTTVERRREPVAVAPAAESGSSVYRAPEESAAQQEEGSVGIGIDEEVQSTFGLIMNIISGTLYVLLALIAIFVFFRRTNARLVDTRTAMRDALWGGVFAAAAITIPALGEMVQDGPEEFWMLILSVGMVLVFTGAGGAFLIFLSSGAMDSVAREKWSAKLATLDLVRRGTIRSVAVGRTLLMGVSGAFILMGITTLLLMLIPDAIIYTAESAWTLDSGAIISVFGFMFAANAWVGMYLGFTVMLGVGTWLYRRKRSAWLVVVGLALILTLVQTWLIPIHPKSMATVFNAANAVLLAWLFWRYDFVAFFTAHLFATVAMAVSTGWMLAGSPLLVDAVLTLIAIVCVVAAGLVGVLSGRTSTEIESYEPSYIKELREEQRLKRDLEIAQEVQRSFLPRQMPQVDGLDIAAMCLPAQQVGGDYYDFIQINDDEMAVVIGDVSGKGIQASFYMTLAKGFVQTLAREDLPPVEVLLRINRLFWHNAPRGMFISMIYGVINIRDGVFRFARAGHNPPIIRRAPAEEQVDSSEDSSDFLRPRGMAVGLTGGSIFDVAIEESSLTLHEGDALVLYTDGFPEATNQRKEQYGEERLVRVVERSGERSAHEIMQRIAESVALHVGDARRHDDMTMIVMRRTEMEAGGELKALEQDIGAPRLGHVGDGDITSAEETRG